MSQRLWDFFRTRGVPLIPAVDPRVRRAVVEAQLCRWLDTARRSVPGSKRYATAHRYIDRLLTEWEQLNKESA